MNTDEQESKNWFSVRLKAKTDNMLKGTQIFPKEAYPISLPALGDP